MSRFATSLERLVKVGWGEAPDWDDRARALLESYYRRLALAWPSGRSSLPPANPEIVAAALAPCSKSEREEIAAAVASISSAASRRAYDLEPATRDLLPAILAWSLAVDASRLATSADPGAPLLDLFEAGFQLGYRHEGIHIHYRSGWRIYQPTRTALARLDAATEVEHQLGELGSAVAKHRAAMLLSLCEVPPTDPAVIAACERLLEDTTLTVIGIPYRFGEIRAVAAEAVWAIRARQGIDKAVVLPGVLTMCTTNDVAALARAAGIVMNGNGVDGVLATLAELVAAEKVPRRDIRLETVAAKV